MADIFISYKHAQRREARQLASALSGRGWTVWWDWNIPTSKDSHAELDAQLDAAGCVVVLWSAESVQSEWVLYEARHGERNEKLIEAVLEPLESPAEFASFQRVDLAGWELGAPFHAGFDRLRAAIRDLLDRRAPLAPSRSGTLERDPGREAGEAVLLGASVPSCARSGEEFAARFVAYLAAEELEVLEMLNRLSPRATAHPRLRVCRWGFDTRVHVSLKGNWIHVSNPVQEFVWRGSRVLLDFDAQVADDAPEGTTLLKFDVMIDGIVVAPIRIDLGVGPSDRQGSMITAKIEAARTAFASYASADRARVLDRIAAVRISAGLDVFLDCLSLHPGEAWKPRLADEIRARDLFLLFWTAAAADSKWVTWEWETALAAKDKNSLQVHPLESGVAPPEQLKDLHFGDVMMLIRESTTRRADGNE